MKKLKQVLYFIVFMMVANKLYSLYPDKSGYSYDTKFSDIYVGLSIGTVATNTWGQKIGYGFQSFVQPQRLLESGQISALMGFRMFQNTPIARNFRLEGEIQYLYSRSAVIYAQDKISADFDKATLSDYGAETLKNTALINLLYDFRHFSNLVYPYFGAGFGFGTLVVTSFDLNQQANGLGEEYGIRKNIPLNQFIFGIQYDTKVIKSSVFLQYKLIMSPMKVKVTPVNDGVHDAKPGTGADGTTACPGAYESPVEGCPDLSKATTSPMDIMYMNHVLSFGFRYYLY